MASGTKKSTTKKSTGRRRESAKAREARLRAQRQTRAIILMAVGLLFCALVFLPGEGIWNTVHKAMFGLLGIVAWGAALIPVYLAATLASDKRYTAFRFQAALLAVLAVLVAAMIQAGGGTVPESKKLMEMIPDLYAQGIAMKGGGLIGSLLAVPLVTACGRMAALVILGLGIFICLMFLTGSTLGGLYSGVVEKPARKVSAAYNDAVDTLSQRIAEAEPRRPRFNIDVPMPTKPPADPLAEEEPLPLEEPGARHALNEAARRFFSPDVPLQSDRREISATAEAFGDGRPELPVEETADPVIPFVPAEPEAVEEQPETQYMPMEAVPAAPAMQEESELEVPEEPDHEYIDEIIRRMAQKQAAAREQNREEPPAAPAVQPTVEAAPAQAPVQTQAPVQEATAAAAPVAVQPERSYVFPSVTLLNEPQPRNTALDGEQLKQNAQRLVDTLQSFGVQTRIIDISRGPAVTRYELQPSAGVKISKITNLADDIALNLAASGVRIEAPIPGKPAVGIEVPNKDISTVTLREVIDSGAFVEAKSKLSVALGRDIAGNLMLADLAKMPHVLIAGATGSGKSVCINSIIMSILYKATDEEVKLLMIDPKVVELGIYNGIPHLLVPVVTDPKKAAGALNWAVGEMLRRYKTFAENNVRDLESYNEMARSHETLPTMPQIVIIIDELSDLMMAAPKDVEDAICRLAQMARAAGMHLVIATQRPSVDVITGIIKANVPSRIAFAVSSQVDSRTILDAGGAEKLLGRGDMLYAPVGSPKPARVQGCFVSNKEVERVVDFIKEGQIHTYDNQVMEEIEKNVPAEKGAKSSSGEDGGGFDDHDDLLMDAIECVVEAGQASTSMIQRRLKVGYARAGRLVDEMEEMGIVGPFEGSKPRQVLISKERWYEMKLQKSE